MAAATLTADKPQLRPDANGRFGKFGGKYVPETLIAALAELEQAYAEAQADPSFQVYHLTGSAFALRWVSAASRPAHHPIAAHLARRRRHSSICDTVCCTAQHGKRKPVSSRSMKASCFRGTAAHGHARSPHACQL